jgi:hypothetical protein
LSAALRELWEMPLLDAGFIANLDGGDELWNPILQVIIA